MEESFQVRLITQSDESLFKQLMNEYIREYVTIEKTYPVRFDPKMGEVYWKNITEDSQDHVVIVAQQVDELLGFCIGEIHHFGEIERTYFEGDRRAEIWDIYVSSEHRGSGIGGEMISQIEKEFVVRGCKNMVLNGVDIDNEGAKKLYEKLGYRPWNMKYYKRLG